MRLGNIDVPVDCATISPILSRIGDKWVALVVLVLSEKPKRYNQIKREVESISQRMLTVTLRTLERDGMVVRRVHAAKSPPHVEYELTAMARTLVPTLISLCQWAGQNSAAIAANQSRHDQAAGAAAADENA